MLEVPMIQPQHCLQMRGKPSYHFWQLRLHHDEQAVHSWHTSLQLVRV